MTRCPNLLALFLCGLTVIGCSQNAPAPKATDTDAAKAELTPTPGEAARPIKTAPALTTASSDAKAASFPDAAFLRDDVLGLVVLHPRRLTEWPVYHTFQEAGLLKDYEQQIATIPVKPEAIERVTLVIDQLSVNKTVGAVGLPGAEPPTDAAEESPVPTVILTLAAPADRDAILKVMPDLKEDAHAGVPLHHNGTVAVCFVNDKTVLFGTLGSVRRMLDAHKSDKRTAPAILDQLEPTADFALAFDIESQSTLIGQLSQIIQPLGVALQIKTLGLQLNVTGKPGGKLLELVTVAVSEDAAKLLAQLAEPGLMQLKLSLDAIPFDDQSEHDNASKKLVDQIAAAAKIQQMGDRVEFLIPVPEGIEKLPELLKPALKQASDAAAEMTLKNNLKSIGIGFYNYDNTHMNFPGAGRGPDGKEGLSWRVYLLPYLGEEDLYAQFNLDEPWDSETNKALIEKMPSLYQVNGVTEPGKTSLHVFTGSGAPFADGQAPKLQDIKDGASSTILVVQAGVDKADFWTKPGGLDFDPKDPAKSLGNVGDQIMMLLFDGASKKIDAPEPETLRRLIQSQDGEQIEGF